MSARLLDQKVAGAGGSWHARASKIWVEAGEGVVEARGRRTPVAHPRIVSANEALPLLPAILRPGLRLLGLPGFLVVERRVVTRAQTQRRRRPSRRRG